jgi:hypothetical protein
MRLFYQKKHKYGAKRTEVMGIKFDSKKEANRYLELLLLQRAKEIKELELQPEFLLLPPFKYKNKSYREIKYKADFKYKNKEGQIIVEDVKGFKTDVYNLKKKMFLYQYPEIEFREL